MRLQKKRQTGEDVLATASCLHKAVAAAKEAFANAEFGTKPDRIVMTSLQQRMQLLEKVAVPDPSSACEEERGVRVFACLDQ